MESLMNDQNIFLLTPHIQSIIKNKTSNKCHENEELNEKDQTQKTRFARYFFSGSKIPNDLMNSVVESCKDSEFASYLSDNIINNKIVHDYNIRIQFQTNVLKTLIAKLEKEGICVHDDIYNRFGDLVGQTDEEQVDRVYLRPNLKDVMAVFTESAQQLSKGTTGLSVWQASCDLANLCSILPISSSTILELGAGCGVSGISTAAKYPDSTVYVTDYDENVLNLLKQNVEKNKLTNCHVESIDWFNFKSSQWKHPIPEFVIAADVVYDISLLSSLCDVISYFLQNGSKCAIVACTLRNPESLEKFEMECEKHQLRAIEKIYYENEEYRVNNGISIPHSTLFPFSSTIQTPTIFYNLQISSQS